MRSDNIIWTHLQEVLGRFADYFSERLRENLMKHVATGELINSIETRVDVGELSYSVTCSLEGYWKYLNDGTGPAHEPDARGHYYPPINVIREWIRVKNIMPEVRPIQLKSGKWVERMPTVKQLPYAIQRGIYNNGTRATHFFDQAKEDTIEYFKESIKLAIDEDIAEYVANNIAELKGLLVH